MMLVPAQQSFHAHAGKNHVHGTLAPIHTPSTDCTCKHPSRRKGTILEAKRPMTSCIRNPRSPHSTIHHSPCRRFFHHFNNHNQQPIQKHLPVRFLQQSSSVASMSWMDSWSRPNKHAATPPPLYLTAGDSVPYCHSCGRVIGQRRTNGATQVKYCSARCRNSKPGPIDQKIEATFAALLNGASPESLKAEPLPEEDQGKPKEVEKPIPDFGKGEKKHQKKTSKSKMAKGDHRIIVECSTVQDIVFPREKDPEKVYGRRKNRKARFVVEKPEDWRSVDMVDGPAPLPSTKQQQQQQQQPISEEDEDEEEDQDPISDSDSENNTGGIVLEPSVHDLQNHLAAHSDSPTPTTTYGYGSGKIRPPQSQNDVNGSVGGEKGWAERIHETDEMKLKRREGQRRADEREMVRKAARRGCAFGFLLPREGGEGSERRKCEAVMKGVVVESSFAKGEWGVRWRERE